MTIPQVDDEHVKVPMNKAAFFELVGPVHTAGVVLQNELEDGRRTCLDKIDKYFYEAISSLVRQDGRP